MGKIKRNDPCPCRSGKKYKKCCLPKKEEKKRLKRESLAKERQEEKVARQRRFKEERREMVEREIEKKRLDHLRLIEGMNLLYSISRDHEDFSFLLSLTEKLRERHPAFYKKNIHIFYNIVFTAALALDRLDPIISNISYFHPHKNPLYFHSIKQFVLYLSELEAIKVLKEHMEDVELKVRHTYIPSSHAQLHHRHDLIMVKSIFALSEDPMMTAENLYRELKPALSYKVKEDWVEDNILTPMRGDQTLIEKFSIYEERPYALGWALVSHYVEEGDVPLSRALLGVHGLHSYFHYKNYYESNEEEEHDSDAIPISYMPEIESFLAFYRNQDLISEYGTFALLEMLPFYLDLLEDTEYTDSHTILSFRRELERLAQGFFDFLRSVTDHLYIYKKPIERMASIYNVRIQGL